MCCINVLNLVMIDFVNKFEILKLPLINMQIVLFLQLTRQVETVSRY